MRLPVFPGCEEMKIILPLVHTMLQLVHLTQQLSAFNSNHTGVVLILRNALACRHISSSSPEFSFIKSFHLQFWSFSFDPQKKHHSFFPPLNSFWMLCIWVIAQRCVYFLTHCWFSPSDLWFPGGVGLGEVYFRYGNAEVMRPVTDW